MAEEQAAHHLLNVLEARSLNVDLDKILLAFEDENTKTAAAAWVEEYLHEETLLTKEELALYQSLKKKGQLHQYESEGEPVRPILDHEISIAIESLRSSTSAIEAQSKVLEAQKDALMKLKALDKPNLDVEHARNERRRKEGQERARLDIAIEDASVSLTEQLAETQKEIDMEKSELQSYLSERLGSDDQILSRLPGLVSQIVTESEVSEDEKSIEQWCKAIISFRTAEIKARVDTTYLRSLAKYTTNGTSEASEAQSKEHKAALQAEMEELHSEINSVAEMVVEHEIRKPMNEMKDRKDRDVMQARNSWLKYVLSTLEYMSKRLDTIAKSTADVEELQHIVTTISRTAKKSIADTNGTVPTPTKRRAASIPSSAFTPMVKLKPIKSLELPAAIQDALRHVGMSYNQDSIEALQDSLAQTQLERNRKLQEHYETTSTSIHERLAERSNKADTDLRVIMDVLYKHTPYKQVSLTDSAVDQQLKSMERELEQKDRELLDVEGQELSLDNAQVRAFVAKYGK